MEQREYKRFLNFLRKHDCQLPFQDYRQQTAGARSHDLLRAARSIGGPLPTLSRPMNGKRNITMRSFVRFTKLVLVGVTVGVVTAAAQAPAPRAQSTATKTAVAPGRPVARWVCHWRGRRAHRCLLA